MVKEGYKETEIGVIPADWHLLTAKNLMKIETGSRNTEHKSDNGKYLFFVRSQQVEHIDSYHYDCEAVLTAGDGVGTGKVFHYINGKFDAHQRVYVMSQFKEISGKFFYNYFKENFGNEVAKYTAKSSVDSVRRDMIAEMLIPVPSLEEQQKIAETLSDMDNFISFLEKLIKKKKAIKQGAMQELLNGQKRLPGFAGMWNHVTIGKMTEVFSGGTPNTSVDGYWGGTIPWMNSGELNLKIVRDVAGRITKEGLKNSSTHFIPPFCVLIGLAGQGKTRGTAAYNTFSLCTNQSIAAIYPNDDEFNSKYLYYVMDTQYDNLRELSSGDSGRGGLTKKLLQDYIVYIPHDIEEQSAIASILSDMDDEIESLEQKLAKYQKLKQGMMQQLLTGKIRLV